MAKKMITTAEAAEMLGISPQRVRDLIRDKRLAAKKYGSKRGGIWLVSRKSVENFERRDPGRPPKSQETT